MLVVERRPPVALRFDFRTLLAMLRVVRRTTRCLRYTIGAHQLDLHSGLCAFCGRRLSSS